MDSIKLGLTRRGLVHGGLAAATGATVPTSAAAATRTSPTRRDVGAPRLHLAELERETGIRIGVVAGTGTRPAISHRADELFPMCSLFKTLLVAELLRHHAYDDGFWSQAIAFDASDVVENSAITSQNSSGEMTVSELVDAALRYSDNTAGNLLLRLVGGPAALTEAIHGQGALRTRLDRWEPELNQALPGDERDTSTPLDIFHLFGDALGGRSLDRLGTARLRDWMLRNTTSSTRMRAAIPVGNELADKTGAGAYGVVNDAGVAWHHDAAITIAIMTRTDDPAASNNNDVVREVADRCWKALT